MYEAEVIDYHIARVEGAIADDVAALTRADLQIQVARRNGAEAELAAAHQTFRRAESDLLLSLERAAGGAPLWVRPYIYAEYGP